MIYNAIKGAYTNNTPKPRPRKIGPRLNKAVDEDRSGEILYQGLYLSRMMVIQFSFNFSTNTITTAYPVFKIKSYNRVKNKNVVDDKGNIIGTKTVPDTAGIRADKLPKKE